MSYGIENVDRSLNTQDARRMALTGSIRDFEALLFASNGTSIPQGLRQATAMSNAAQQDAVASDTVRNAVEQTLGIDWQDGDNVMTYDDVGSIDAQLGTQGVHGLYSPDYDWAFVADEDLAGYANSRGVSAESYYDETVANELTHKSLNNLGVGNIMSVEENELVSDGASLNATDEELTATGYRMIENAAVAGAMGGQTSDNQVENPSYGLSHREVAEGVGRYYVGKGGEFANADPYELGQQWLNEFGTSLLNFYQPPAEPAATEPASTDPVAGGPAVEAAPEQPVNEQPVEAQPVAEQPSATSEPVSEPVVSQPAETEPVAGEGADEQPAEPSTNTSGPAYQPVIEDQLTRWGGNDIDIEAEWKGIHASIEQEVVDAAGAIVDQYDDNYVIPGESDDTTAVAAAESTAGSGAVSATRSASTEGSPGNEPAGNDNAVNAKVSQFA